MPRSLPAPFPQELQESRNGPVFLDFNSFNINMLRMLAPGFHIDIGRCGQPVSENTNYACDAGWASQILQIESVEVVGFLQG